MYNMSFASPKKHFSQIYLGHDDSDLIYSGTSIDLVIGS